MVPGSHHRFIKGVGHGDIAHNDYSRFINTIILFPESHFHCHYHPIPHHIYLHFFYQLYPTHVLSPNYYLPNSLTPPPPPPPPPFRPPTHPPTHPSPLTRPCCSSPSLPLLLPHSEDLRYAYRAGDPIINDARTIHGVLPNTSDRWRLVLWCILDVY